MNDTVIQVENLWKQYRVGVINHHTLTRDLQSWWARVRGRDDPNSIVDDHLAGHSSNYRFWALQNVSFEVKRGDVLGIIGRNGAGKSTLLKILSQVTAPTKGEIRLKGRIASLLEVGTGFHPELTGRENIFLNGAILGMSKTDIRSKIDEIVAFAEVEKFIDTPVKRYSSGMYVRLAFAVAAHLEPEILVVDEVLSVGDMQFQKKCMGKMQSVGKEGRTVLFVSHNMAAVENLCQKAMLIEKGRINFIGAKTNAIDRYLSTTFDKRLSLKERTDRSGTGEVRVYSIEIRDENNNILNEIKSGQTIDINLYYEKMCAGDVTNVIASVAVRTGTGIPVFLQHNRLTGDIFGSLPEKGAVVCRIEHLPLPPSNYQLSYSIMKNGEYLDTISNACSLQIIEGDYFGSGEVPPITHGVCLVDANWRIEVPRGLDTQG